MSDEKPVVVEGKKYCGLCHRCNERANFKETGHAARYECGTNMAVYNCYCYKPVRPMLMRKAKGDKRPRFAGWGIASREEGVGVAGEKEIELAAKETKAGIFLYWRPVGLMDALFGKLIKDADKKKSKGVKKGAKHDKPHKQKK